MIGAAAVLVLAACGSDDDSRGPLADDQTLRIAISGEPDSIDPSLADFAESITVTRNLFATLLRLDPTTNTIHPYVATEVPTVDNGGISDDGLTYTFTLSSEAVWEDGEPLTAHDFAYSLKRLMDPRVGSYYGTAFYSGLIEGGAELADAVEADGETIEALRDAVGVTAVDDYTLEIRLARPSATFTLLMSMWPSSALRQDVIEAHGDIADSGWTQSGSLVASGPFRLAEWDHGSRIVLERNPNFWLDEMSPVLDRVVFNVIEDENTAHGAYLRGQVDMAPVPLASLTQIAEDEKFAGELVRMAAPSTFAVLFNQSEPPFNKLEARRAFCRAIDRATMVAEIRQGNGRPTTAWVPPSLSPYFVDARGEALVLDIDAARSDLGTAVGVLAAAEASARASFPSVKITYADVGPNASVMEFLQGQWSQHLDVDVGLRALDPPSFGAAFNTGDFQLTYIGFGQDYHHPENWLVPWMTDSGMNPGGYSNTEFDAVVQDAMAETDPDEAVALWQRAEEILIDEDVGVCALFNGEMAWLVKPHVDGLAATGTDVVPGEFFLYETAITQN
jgi:oligopeptide transport system substrate-binding protein